MSTTTSSILTAFCLAFLVVSHRAPAVSPPPDGGYPGINTAEGEGALFKLTNGVQNTAIGNAALHENTSGNSNTAIGALTLRFNVTGRRNTAIGVSALNDSTGSGNTALGDGAGERLTSGNGNVYIGAEVGGVSEENNTTRIKNVFYSFASGRAVYVDSDNKIGTLSSSHRYKENIKPMDRASEAILALKPVSFRYKKEIDAAGTSQFGLIAEDLAETDPELVTRDAQGKPETVRYDAVNAMLLNEFLKEHRQVQKQKTTIAELKSAMAQQEKQIESLTVGLQKVSAQLELNKAAPQTVKNSE